MDKKDEQFVFPILSKLDLDYSIFVSTFHVTSNSLGDTWKMPSLDEFSTALTRKKDKLVQMGSLKDTKDEDLDVI